MLPLKLVVAMLPSISICFWQSPKLWHGQDGVGGHESGGRSAQGCGRKSQVETWWLTMVNGYLNMKSGDWTNKKGGISGNVNEMSGFFRHHPARKVDKMMRSPTDTWMLVMFKIPRKGRQVLKSSHPPESPIMGRESWGNDPDVIMNNGANESTNHGVISLG